METNSDTITLLPNRRSKLKSILVLSLLALLPGLFVFLACMNEGDLRTAYWIACGAAVLVILRASWTMITGIFGRPAAILKPGLIVTYEGVEIPAGLVNEIVLLRSSGEKLIGLRLVRGAARLYPQIVERLNDKSMSWVTMRLALTLPYNGLTLPGQRVVAILREKYGFPVREQKLEVKSP